MPIPHGSISMAGHSGGPNPLMGRSGQQIPQGPNPLMGRPGQSIPGGYNPLMGSRGQGGPPPPGSYKY